MRLDQEPWDLQLRQAKQAYRDLGPSEAQLERMLGAIEAPVPSAPPRGAVAGVKLSKVVVVTLGVIAAGAWFANRKPEPALPQPPSRPRVELVPTSTPLVSPQQEAPSSQDLGPPQGPLSQQEHTPPQELGEPLIELPTPSSPKPRKPVRDRKASVHGGTAALADELALLSRARRILPRDPARALSLAETHAHDYPDGVFAEERELLAVQALLAAARRAEAERRATRFERVHPNSVHGHRMRVLFELDAD